MTKLRAGAVLVSLLAGCGSDAPPGTTLGLDKTLPDSPLARLQDVSLMRAGDAFTLAGYDAAGSAVRWARVTLDGTVAGETSFPMAPPVVGPVFAATGKSLPGDQLVAISVVASSTVIEGYDLLATVHTVGVATPAAPILLANLPAGTDPAKVSLTAGASSSGNLGFVAWGIRVAGIPVSYFTLPADALTTGAPGKFLDDPVPANVPAWDCLAVQSRPTGVSFGVVTPGNSSFQTSDFQTLDIDDSGGLTQMTYQLTVLVKSCEIVGAPNPSGSYFMAFQGSSSGGTAIDFATYYPPADPAMGGGTVTTQHPVLPAAKFGDPLNMPSPAWVSSAGVGDVVVGLTRRAGPQVFRFRYDAVQHGGTLQLRTANGDTGPVAAWVGQDGVYATYADQVKSGAAATIQRYFMRIDSPASLP